jgi:hypothetical protein
MTELTPELEATGRELHAALGHRIAKMQRRLRRARRVAVVVAAFGAFAGIAIASGIDEDLHLNPTEWTIFSSGSVDNGRGAYVNAHATDGSGDSTFMVEHDAALERYDAFLLHERLVDAAGDGIEKGSLCSRAELTRAEQVALAALRSALSADTAVKAEFAGQPCRGLEYASEQARLVYSGVQPKSLLMPGAS